MQSTLILFLVTEQSYTFQSMLIYWNLYHKSNHKTLKPNSNIVYGYYYDVKCIIISNLDHIYTFHSSESNIEIEKLRAQFSEGILYGMVLQTVSCKWPYWTVLFTFFK